MLKLTIGLALVTLAACLRCPNNAVCEAGQTCCQAPSGDTSCCPFHHGECCEDHLHCCPEGMLCQVMESMCQNATHSLPWVERMHVEQTRLPKSFRMIPSLPASENNITCPDGSCCPAEFSCLLMSTSYGCCPVAQGIVCSDGKHCCPKGHKCSADSSSCVKHKGMEVNAESLSLDSDVPCDDTAACPDNTTCCKTKDGGWSCCPLPKAVCCDDFIHCCPHGKKCDVAAGTCDDSSGSVPWFEKVPVQPISSLSMSDTKLSDVPCDDTVACPDNTTCCKTKDGGWACCPFSEAVCCDDFLHCCPHGKTCDVAAGTCDDSSGSVPWFEKVPVQPISSLSMSDTKISDVPCDDTAACPDNTTCCKTKDGGWSCCPLPKAVCCDDFIHCCPHGKKCDVAAGKCDDPSGSVPWFEKFPAQPIQVTSVSSVSDVPCDDTVACEDDTTCCKTKDGGWACCPLSEAVCCDDFIHCCPHGKKCNLAAMTCDDPSGSVPWFEKVPTKPISSQNSADTQVSSVSSVSNVPCDDTVACEDDTTCCKTKDGEWACCPFPEGVCCDDFLHCCPHGKKCNLAAMTCDDPSGSVPWLEKVPARPRAGQRAHENVSCDSDHICPESNTCCKDIEGAWNCCPLPEAVCCLDHFHCCPQGTTCNLITLTCDRGSTSVPMTLIISDLTKEGHRQEVKKETGEVRKYDGRVPCDAHTSCPDHTTCCLIVKTNKWGCCPLPDAVCCKDGEHCCPAHYECDMSTVSCIKKDVVIPWYNKIAAQSTPAPSSDLGEVKCDDQVSCSTGSTCCRMYTGAWGCCPIPEAVCCPDLEHCCPKGYTCDMGGSSCVKNLWVQADRLPLIHIGGKEPRPVKDIQCGDGYSCLDSETCCPTSETSWGCCPSAKAICCDDMKHCCPAGYKCTDEGNCTKASDLKWNSWSN